MRVQTRTCIQPRADVAISAGHLTSLYKQRREKGTLGVQLTQPVCNASHAEPQPRRQWQILLTRNQLWAPVVREILPSLSEWIGIKLREQENKYTKLSVFSEAFPAPLASWADQSWRGCPQDWGSCYIPRVIPASVARLQSCVCFF